MAKCNPKTLRGIFGIGRKLGFGIEELRAMADTDHLSRLPERQAADLFQKLRAYQSGNSRQKLWRLYSSSTLAREIKFYASLIRWNEPGGFAAWLKKCFKIERLEWVDSFDKAVAIKNALKRMYNEQQKRIVS